MNFSKDPSGMWRPDHCPKCNMPAKTHRTKVGAGSCTSCGYVWPAFVDERAARHHYQTVPSQTEPKVNTPAVNDFADIAKRMKALGLAKDSGIQTKNQSLEGVYLPPVQARNGNGLTHLGDVNTETGWLCYFLKDGLIHEFLEGASFIAQANSKFTPDFLRKQAKAWLKIATEADGLE